MIVYAIEALIAVVVFGSLFGALELGRWFGRRSAAKSATPGDPDSAASTIGSLQGALLGLFGLLLAFAFAGSASRFIERQDYVVREANAIGTADLRADLLPDQQRAELRSILREYLERRLALHGAFLADEVPIVQDMERLQRRMWSVAIQGVAAQPTAAILVLPALNEVIDLHGSRAAAMRRHAPLPVLLLLLASGMLTLGAVGLGSHSGGRRHDSLARYLTLLASAALWLTIDLDYPRGGLVKMDITPLKSLLITDAPK